MSQNAIDKQKLLTQIQFALDGLSEFSGEIAPAHPVKLLGASLYHNNHKRFDERSTTILATGFNRAAGRTYKDFVINVIHPQRIPLVGTSIGQVFTTGRKLDCSQSAYRSDQICFNAAFNKDYAVQLIYSAPYDADELALTQVARHAKNLMTKSALGVVVKDAPKTALIDITADAFMKAKQPNHKTAILCSYDISASTALRQNSGRAVWQNHLQDTRKLAFDQAQRFGGQIVRVEGDCAHVLFAASGYDCDDVLDLVGASSLPYARALLSGYEQLKSRTLSPSIQGCQLRLAQSFSDISLNEISARYAVTDYMGDAFLINRRLLDALPRERGVIAMDDTLAQYIPEVTLLQKTEQLYTHYKASRAYLF